MFGRRSNYNYYDRERLSSSFEKDVVYLDIWGKGVFPRLRRWWNDLFLLSYSDSRSKHYYMSSYTMMMARTAQFRHNRKCIHPISKFRDMWDFLILHLLIIRIVFFHFNASIIHDPHKFFHYMVAIIEYVFILDFYINTKTGYVIKRTRQIVMKPYDIIIHYLSTHAFIHALTAIPFQTLMFLRLGSSISEPHAKANLFVSTLKVMSTVHVIRLLQASEYWAKERGSFKKTVIFKFVRIIVVGLIVSLNILTFTTALSVILMVRTDAVPQDSFLYELIRLKYQTPLEYSANESFFLFIKIARTCKSFFLFGYGLLPNTECFDQMSSILTHWVAFMFHFWASIVVYNCVSRASSLDDRMSIQRSQTLSFLQRRTLPDSIHTKVVNYYNYNMSSWVIVEKSNRLMRALPKVLLVDIKMKCYRKHITKIHFFSKFPDEVISKVVVLLEPEVYLAGDIVNSTRCPQESLVVLEAGVLAVYSETKELGHLVDGDHFGALALVTHRAPSTPTVVAITPSMVLLLEKIHFLSMMRQHPELFYSLRN